MSAIDLAFYLRDNPTAEQLRGRVAGLRESAKRYREGAQYADSGMHDDLRRAAELAATADALEKHIEEMERE